MSGRWMFDHCPDCAADDEGARLWDAGVGCSADGPCDGCAAVWIWKPRDASSPPPQPPALQEQDQ